MSIVSGWSSAMLLTLHDNVAPNSLRESFKWSTLLPMPTPFSSAFDELSAARKNKARCVNSRDLADWLSRTENEKRGKKNETKQNRIPPVIGNRNAHPPSACPRWTTRHSARAFLLHSRISMWWSSLHSLDREFDRFQVSAWCLHLSRGWTSVEL